MQQSLGGELHLNSIEVKANRVLMAAKNRELHDGSIFSLFIIKRIRDRCSHGQVSAIIYVPTYRGNDAFFLLLSVICPPHALAV
jgi:hypothetical protein